MIITHDQFKDFEKAKQKKIGNFGENGLMSRERWKLTSLNINTYIYIADNYDHLKERNKNERSKI